MEKFGIFELLDALSALTDKAESAVPPETEKEPQAPSAGTSALNAFLSRHEAVSARAGKK